MDALILSCGTGGGHNSAGKAVKLELEGRGHHAVMLNPYDLYNDRLADKIDHTYISAATNVPGVFGAVYVAGELYRRLPFRSPVYFVNHKLVPVMQDYLNKNHFDIVIMTHLFPAEILTNMKQHGMETPGTIFIATDYTCIPFTEETECDAYVIPSPELKSKFAGRGIPEGKLYPFGIPTHKSFVTAQSREEAKAQLGLKPEKKYILISGGSIGAGNMERNIRKIQKQFQADPDIEWIVICGKNKDLYQSLQESCKDNMQVVGYTDHMAAYLKASHLFITKPGGLSTTEAAVCGTPILHISPIPGCEISNARFFSRRGMSIYSRSSRVRYHSAAKLLDSEETCSSMAACQRKYVNKDAAHRVCELAEQMVLQKS